MIQESEQNQYIPGACNLGQMEVRRRFRNGFMGVVCMIFFIGVIEYFKLSPYCRIALFAPAFYAFSGFIQGLSKFCYVFGLKGLISLTGVRKFERVTNVEALARDRKHAYRIISLSTLGSVIVTVIYFFIS